MNRCKGTPWRRTSMAWNNLTALCFKPSEPCLISPLEFFTPAYRHHVGTASPLSGPNLRSSVKMSAGVFTTPSRCSVSSVPRANPRISSASLAQKCNRRSIDCEGHFKPPVHRTIEPIAVFDAERGARTTDDPQSGHLDGGSHSGSGLMSSAYAEASARSSPASETTRGMTSPARSTVTCAPTLRCLRAISSKLCNVAREMDAPPMSTGSSNATGVSAPVRPT